MPSATQTAPTSKKMCWTGRILTIFVTLFLLFDSGIKILKLAPAVEGTIQLGYPESVVRGLGITLLLCLATYLIPRTSILGAILLTGYLGGAVASNLRVGHPLFGYILAPVYVALFAWGGLYFRDERVRALIPLRKLDAADIQ